MQQLSCSYLVMLQAASSLQALQDQVRRLHAESQHKSKAINSCGLQIQELRREV